MRPVIKTAIYEKLDVLLGELTKSTPYVDGGIQGLVYEPSRAIEAFNKTRVVLSLGGGGSVPDQVSFPNVFFKHEFMSGLEHGASVIIIAIDKTFEHEHIRRSFSQKIELMFEPPSGNVVSAIIPGLYSFIHICFLPIQIPTCVDQTEIARNTFLLQRPGATLKHYMNYPPCDMGPEHRPENTHWVSVFTKLIEKLQHLKVYVQNDAWWHTGVPFGMLHERLDPSLGHILSFGINFEQLGIIPFVFGKHFTNYGNLFIIRIRDGPTIIPFFDESAISRYGRANFSRPENAALLGLPPVPVRGGRRKSRRRRHTRRRKSFRGKRI
jgi:hypothetical protein